MIYLKKQPIPSLPSIGTKLSGLIKMGFRLLSSNKIVICYRRETDKTSFDVRKST